MRALTFLGVPNSHFVYPTYLNIIPPSPKPRYNHKDLKVCIDIDFN